MWMVIKSVVSVAAIVGYNHCYAPRHRIKEALDVSLSYSSPCVFRILSKLIWCSSGGCIPSHSRCASMSHTLSIDDKSGEQEGQGSNSIDG
ncbi:hypothetical protein TNCV_936631 [Trichonephila clavipes]|nr:hypothetical protein TNCV_936631 [Trichonephila clavipes]